MHAFTCGVLSHMFQVELGGVELERMCKKVLNASVDGGADFVVVDGNGITRLPDYFPHYLPNPKVIRV